MISPEENQMEICLLKSNLEAIVDNLVENRASWPELDLESEHKCRETLNALRQLRSFNEETELLKQENVSLVAKRMQLKQRCDNMKRAIEAARSQRSLMEADLKREDQERELLIRNYEESFRAKAERFRTTRRYYNKEDILSEVVEIETSNYKIQSELLRRETSLQELRNILLDLKSEVPENLLQIIGKEELEFQMKMLAEEYNTLEKKRIEVIKQGKLLALVSKNIPT